MAFDKQFITDFEWKKLNKSILPKRTSITSLLLISIYDRSSLPEFKALRDMTRGILSSGSVRVNQIARAIPELTALKMTVTA